MEDHVGGHGVGVLVSGILSRSVAGVEILDGRARPRAATRVLWSGSASQIASSERRILPGANPFDLPPAAGALAASEGQPTRGVLT